MKLSTDFLADKDYFTSLADKVVYTGALDEYYGYRFGALQYRSLRFEHEQLDIANYQGNAVVNYTEASIPFTRIIEHKHFEFGTQAHTIITREYPAEWTKGMEPYYPVNDDQNMERFKQYQQLAAQEKNVLFGGRLAEYKYYDMHQVIAAALVTARKELAAE